MKKCEICETGIIKKVNDIKLEIGRYIFTVRGEHCNNCGKEFIDKGEQQKTLETAKKMGIF